RMAGSALEGARDAGAGGGRQAVAGLVRIRRSLEQPRSGGQDGDTSALLKLYLPEPGSDEFNEILEGRDDVLVSDLAVTEIVSAVVRRLHRGSLTRETARRLQHAILGRLDEGGYHRVELTRDVHRRAEHYLQSPPATPLRAADA